MKLFLTVTLLVFAAVPSFGWDLSYRQPYVVDSSGDDCPDATYAFYWDGEHSSGTGYACLDSGNSTVNKSADSGSPTITTDGGDVVVVIDADNESVNWAVDSGDIDHDHASGFTICAEFKMVSGSYGSMVEFSGNASNYAAMRVNASVKPGPIWQGSGTGDDYAHATSVVQDSSTYNTICTSYKYNEAGQDHSASVDGGVSYTGQDDDIVVWAVAESLIKIGTDFYSWAGSGFTLKKMVVIQDFEVADIW